MVAKMAQGQIFLSAVEEEQCRSRNWELLGLEGSKEVEKSLCDGCSVYSGEDT